VQFHVRELRRPCGGPGPAATRRRPRAPRPCGCPPLALKKGQTRINLGLYGSAIAVFSNVIESHPLCVDAYRGRVEAELLLGRYSDALGTYTRLNAFVLPERPDAYEVILAGYDVRLAWNPWSVPALTGASFTRWWTFDYEGAQPVLDTLRLVSPSSLYGKLFRGSNRLFVGEDVAGGEADFAAAIAQAPQSPHVRFIVADGYTYALPDPERALEEATLALQWGLDTPRVHAILASAHGALGDPSAAAVHIEQHIDLVTPVTRSRSRPTARPGRSGTRSSSCSLPTAPPRWAATTTSTTSPASTGSRQRQGPTCCASPRSRASARASWSSPETDRARPRPPGRADAHYP
jgi:hypothetical protein